MIKITKKAFTLVEVFVAMVILSVLVGVCMSFFVNQKDYKREYFYYSAYQNIVKVVDAALMNEAYKLAPTQRVEQAACSGKKCYVFRSASGTLCNVFVDYFSVVGTPNCNVTNATPWISAANSSITLTNGMQFYFMAQGASEIADLVYPGSTVDANGWVFWVDIDGSEQGENKQFYDIMRFYVTRTGKVILDYGQVVGLRGYEYDPAGLDGGGNVSLMSFDVVSVPEDSNVITVINDTARHVSFRDAACKSGYVSDSSVYCRTAPAVVKDGDCTDEFDNCQVRLVKKLKRTRL